MGSSHTPTVVNTYLQAAADDDLESLLGTFTSDAEVVDEDESYCGREAIRHWRHTVASKYTYTVEVIATQARSPDDYVVTAKLEGDFPGSPVNLDYQFTLHDGLITRLTIAP